MTKNAPLAAFSRSRSVARHISLSTFFRPFAIAISFLVVFAVIPSAASTGQPVDSWLYLSSAPATPFAYSNGVAITKTTDYIYVIPGGTTDFWRYQISNNTWIAISTGLPAPAGPGASLVYDGGSIYYVRGSSTTEFYQFDVAASTWTPLSPLLNTVDTGASAVFFNGKIYVLRGTNTQDFWEYNISNNQWTALAQVTVATTGGSAMAYNGANNSIYLYRQSASTQYRYNFTNWVTVTPNHGFVAGNAVSLVAVADRLFYFQGGPTTTNNLSFCTQLSTGNSAWIGMGTSLTQLGTAYGGNRLTIDNQYLFLIKAGNDTGSNKSWWRYRWRDVDPPGAVTGFAAATGANGGEINLSWVSPGNDGYVGNILAGSTFYIQYATWTGVNFSTDTRPPTGGYDISISTTAAIAPGTSVYYTIGGLAGGATHYFRVWSRDNSGNWSPISDGATSWAQVSPPVPAAPSGFDGAALSTSSIKWSWVDNANNEDGYRLKNSTGGVVADLSANTTFWTEWPLQINTSYFRYVEAYNVSGSSASFAFIVYTLANPPTGSNIVSVSSFSVGISWSPNGNPTSFTRWGILRSTDNFVSTNTLTNFGMNWTSTTYVVADLSANTTYWFKVNAFNGDGIAASYDFAITTVTLSAPTDTTPPAAVTNLAGQPGVVAGDVNLQWSMPGDDGWTNPLPAGSQFKIQHSTISDGTGDGKTGWLYQNAQITVSTSGVNPTTPVSYVVADLSAGSTYYFKIWHADEVPNWSGLSNTATTWAQVPQAGLWKSVQGGNWSNVAIWDKGSVPHSLSVVEISHTVTFDMFETETSSISVMNSGTLQFDGAVSSRTLIVAGDVNLQSGGKFLMPPNTGYISALKIKCNAPGEFGIIVNNGGVFDVRGNTTTTPSTRNTLIASANPANKTYIRNLSQTEANFNMYYVEVSSVGVNATGKYGITFDGSGTRGKINYCSIHDSAYAGIYLTYSSSNTITNNSCYSNAGGPGIYLSNSSNNTLSNNSCYSNTEGIYLDYGSNNTISNNSCYSNGYGIILGNNSNNTLSNNSCYSNSYGIEFWNSSNNTLSNNSCYSNIWGIYTDNSSNNTAVNCSLGSGGNNTSGDIYYVGGTASKLTLKNCILFSPTKVNTTGMNTAGSYLVSYNQDGTQGTTKIWGDYRIGQGQALQLQKLNYSETLYVSTATQPNSTLKGTGSITYPTTSDDKTLTEFWEVKCISIGPDTFSIKRGTGTVLYDDTPPTVTGGSLHISNNRGVSFTVNAGSYQLGDAFYFVTISSSGDQNVQKRIEFSSSTIGTKLTVEPGGELQMLGAPGNPTISTASASNVYYGLFSSGTLNLNNYIISNTSSTGLTIYAGNVINLSSGTFNNIQAAVSPSSSAYINVSGLTSAATFYGCVFDGSSGVPDYNIRASGAGINWTFKNWSGPKGGAAYTSATNGAVVNWEGPPLAPSGFAGVAQTTSSIKWTWLDNANDEQGYRLKNSTGGVVADLSANTTYWIEGQASPPLQVNTSYYRYAEAYNPIGVSTGDFVVKYTLANLPSGLYLSNVTSHSATATWSPNGNPTPFTRWGILRSTDSGFTSAATLTDFATNWTNTTYTDSGLTSAATYWYKVNAFNGDGVVSAFSLAIATVTLAPPPAGPGDKVWARSAALGGGLASSAANWSPYGVPTSGDAVYFNATSTQSCAWDVAGAQLSSFTMTAAYAGQVSLSTHVRVQGNVDKSGGSLGVGNNELKIGGDFTSSAGGLAVGSSGRIVFVGTTTQRINAPGMVTFEVASSSEVVNIVSGFMSVNGNVFLSSGVFRAGNEIRVGGDWTQDGGVFDAQSSTVTFDSINLSQNIMTLTGNPFNHFKINSTTNVYVHSAVDINGAFTLEAGTLSLVSAGRINANQSSDIMSRFEVKAGTFSSTGMARVFSGGELDLGAAAASTVRLASGINIGAGGVLSADSASDIITWFGSYYTLSVNGGRINVTGLTLDHSAGVAVQSVTGDSSFNNIKFTNLQSGAYAMGVLHSGASNYIFSGIDFDASVSTNVYAPNLTAPGYIHMSAATGPKSGYNYENDPNGRIFWGSPETPTGANAVSVGVSSITWGWTDNAYEEESYSARRAFDGVILISGLSINTTEWSQTGLLANTSQQVFIRADNPTGYSTSSNSPIRYTLAAVPTGLYLTNVTSHSVTANWSPNGNPAGTFYDLEYSTSPGFVPYDEIYGTVSLTADSTSLMPNTTYYFRANARNFDSINTGFSAVVSTRTLAAALPPTIQPITNLSALAGDFVGAVKLTWTYPQTLVSGASYYIQFSTNPSEAWNFNSAQVTKSTSVSSGQIASAVVGGLDIGRDGSNNNISPNYYFRVWISTAANAFSSISNASTSTATLPAVLTTNFNDYGANNGWLSTINDANNGSEQGNSVAKDNSGNIYITGQYSNGSNDDIIVRKYNSSGVAGWTKYYNGPSNNNDVGNGIAVDTSGNVYVTGYSSVTAQSNNIWVRKYDTNGLVQWTTIYNSPDNSDDAGRSIAADNSGNVYVTGSEQRAGQGNNIWVRKYNTNGLIQWTTTYNSPANNDDVGNGIAVGNDGNVCVAGFEFRGDFAQVENIWITKYDTNGLVLWTTSYNSPANNRDIGQGIAVDGDNNIYVVGRENRAFDLSEGDNIWIRKYTPNGLVQWTTTYNNVAFSGDDAGQGVAVDAAGNVYVAGYENRSDLSQFYNIWVRKYDTNGLVQWTTTYTSPGAETDAGNGIAVDGSGNVYVTGYETVSGQNTNVWVRKYIQNKPNAPTAISPINRATTSITWGWTDNSTGFQYQEEGTRVIRTADGVVLSTVAVDVNQHTQTGLGVNTSSQIRLEAFNVVGSSQSANSPVAYTAANPPSGTQITQVSSFAVTLGWNHNGNPSAYTTYLVWRATDSGGGWSNIIEADFPGMPGSPWTDNNFGSGLASGTSYFYKVQAKNEDGFTTGFDTMISTKTLPEPAKPTSGILYPANSYYNAMNVISGTAAAPADGASVSAVEVFLFDTALGKYWNGINAWSLDAESWFAAAVYPSSWTYDASAATFQNDKEYRVVSRAIDTFSNYETIRATAVFRIDTALPASVVVYPVNNNAYSSLGVVSGTAADAANASFNSGVASVKTRLSRQSDGFFWNGASWVVGEAWLDASGTASWSYNSLPAFTSGYYIVNSRSDDVAGNVEVAFSTSAFYISGPATRLILTVPGETFAPGSAPGKTGSPTSRTAGAAFTITARAVDDNYFFDASTNASVSAVTSDVYDSEPAAQTLVGGTTVFVLNLITGGTSQITITSSGLTSAATNIYVQPATATKLQVLAPGETAVGGKITAAPYGKTGTPDVQTAGAVFNATVNLVDNYYNKVALNEPLVGLTTGDPYDTEPSSNSLVSGMLVFPVTFVTASTSTITASDVDGTGTFYSPDISPIITVNPGVGAKLSVALPGETFAPGSPTGKSGSPSTRITGQSFSITVRAADAYWNLQAASNPVVNIITSDPGDTEPMNRQLQNGTTTFTITFVSTGTWSIAATDMDGTPLESSTSTVVNVLDGTPPAAVTDIAGQPGVSDGAVILNWPAPGDNGWASPLPAGSMFKIQHSTWAGVSWSTTAAQITVSTSGVTPTTPAAYTVAGLTGWATYYFKIWHADNAPNWSGLSNTATSYAADFAAPSVPALISPSSGAVTNALSVNFSWTSSTDGGSGVAGYEIYISTVSNFSVFTSSAFTASNSSLLTLHSSLYFWRVRAVDNASNYSLYPNPYTLIIDTTPPTVPALVSPADGASVGGSANFQWGICPDDLSGLADYKLDIAGDAGFSAIVVTTNAPVNIILIDGLTDGARWWRVSSRDAAGNYSAPSSTRGFVVTASAPAAPTGLSLIAVSTGSMHWTWQAIATNETGYRVQNSADEVIADAISPGTTFFVETGLSPNTAYTRRVRAYNAAGASSKSNDVTAHTLANPPSNLTSLAQTATSITLSWTAGSGGNTRYYVERSTDGVSFSAILVWANAKVETSYTDASNIKPDTAYYYRVGGYNGDAAPTSLTPTMSVRSSIVPPETISGRMTQSNGTPIAAIRVEAAQSDESSGYFVHTSTDGRYTITGVAAGLYRVRARWALNDIVSSAYKDSVANGSVGVDFTLEVNFVPGTIAGVIQRAAEHQKNPPLSPFVKGGSEAGGFRTSASETYVEILKDGVVALKVDCDENGRFEIGNLMPGSYIVRAFNGLSYSSPRSVTLAEGQTAAPYFTFAPIADPDGDVYAYPNPARGTSATIRFKAGVASPKIDLKIYNIAAELIRCADETEFSPSGGGVYKFEWNLANSSERKVASGVYIYVLRVSADGEETVVRKKMAIIK